MLQPRGGVKNLSQNGKIYLEVTEWIQVVPRGELRSIKER
jgi:hypothetical protein